MIAGSINKATWQTQIVSTEAHSQHWLCSRMHMQHRLTSPFPPPTTAMQKFCQHWPSIHATVWTRFNFHAVFWVKYYTSDWTLTGRSWPEQICVSTGRCCCNFTFWVTWTLASTYFLNALPKRIAEGTKEKHTSLQLAYILLKSDKETCTFKCMLEAWSQYSQQEQMQPTVLQNYILWTQYWFLLHSTAEFILFMSHFQTHAKFGLSVKDGGEVNSSSISHIPTLLGPQDFIKFFTRKCGVGHLMLVYQPQRLLNIK